MESCACTAIFSLKSPDGIHHLHTGGSATCRSSQSLPTPSAKDDLRMLIPVFAEELLHSLSAQPGCCWGFGACCATFML